MKKAILLFALLVLCTSLANARSILVEPEPSSTPTASVTESAKPSVPSGKPTLPPEKANPVRIPKFDKPPAIDGKLDDEVWKQAAVLKDFYQVQPGDNTAPSKPTEVLLGYDSKFLYLAYHAFDEPDKVRATIAKRDSIFNDDYVGFFFDTFNDKRKAYEMDFNPLGIQADGILTEGQGEDFSVDLVVESKGMVTTDGYTVEVAIPFKSLRYEAGKDKLWGVHFFRRIKRFNNELDMWMPLSRDQSSWLAQEGHITGLEGLSTERTLELIPSLTLSETGKRVRTIPLATINTTANLTDPGRMLNEPIKFDPGLTAKFGLTPTVTLDLAINPDFAQVEADATVITANQRFPIFFEEKRPFFLEGIDIFRTQIAAVHTRSIVDPDIAAKLTGKRGRNTFGLLIASDNAPGNFSNEELEDPGFLHSVHRYVKNNALIGILRLKRDIGRDSNIGFLATSYNFKPRKDEADDLLSAQAGENPCRSVRSLEKVNQLAGFDGRFRINKATTFDAQVLGTTSHRCFFDPELGRKVYRIGNGFAYAYELNKSGRHFGYNLNGVGRTRDFRSDVGFSRRTNTNNHGLFLRYNSEPNPKGKIIQWRINTNPNTNFDWQGRLQRWNEGTQFGMDFPKQTFIGVGYFFGYERLFEEEFGNKRMPARVDAAGKMIGPQTGAFAGPDPERSSNYQGLYAYTGSTPSKKYNYFVLVEHDWHSFDFDFGGGNRYPRVSPSAIAARDAAAAGLCKGNNQPSVCLGLQDPGPGSVWHFEGNFTYQPTNALRATLSFTHEQLRRDDTGLVAYTDNIVSLRATYQFTRFTFARGRIDYDTLSSSLRGQFLLGWAPNPGTSLYVGYNDDLSRNGYNPFTGQLEPGFRRNGRTFFIKMSYLIRRSF